MFGKKKADMTGVRDFHCGVCGIDCSDGYRLDRHVSWAHPGSETARAEKKELLAAAERKA